MTHLNFHQAPTKHGGAKRQSVAQLLPPLALGHGLWAWPSGFPLLSVLRNLQLSASTALFALRRIIYLASPHLRGCIAVAPRRVPAQPGGCTPVVSRPWLRCRAPGGRRPAQNQRSHLGKLAAIHRKWRDKPAASSPSPPSGEGRCWSRSVALFPVPFRPKTSCSQPFSRSGPVGSPPGHTLCRRSWL